MTRSRQITIYYDNTCGTCSAWAERLRKADRDGRFHVVGISEAASAGPALSEIPPERLLDRLHLIDGEGRIHTGCAAIAYILRRFPLTWPIGLLLSLPGIHYCGERLYNAFASRRHRDPKAGFRGSDGTAS